MKYVGSTAGVTVVSVEVEGVAGVEGGSMRLAAVHFGLAHHLKLGSCFAVSLKSRSSYLFSTTDFRKELRGKGEGGLYAENN